MKTLYLIGGTMEVMLLMLSRPIIRMQGFYISEEDLQEYLRKLKDE